MTFYRAKVSSRKKNKQILKRLYQWLEDKIDSLIANPDEIDNTEIESLEKLGRMIEHAELIHEKHHRRELPVVAGFVVITVIVGGLLYKRMSQTDITLNVITTGVEFMITETSNLLNIAPLSAITVYGIGDLSTDRRDCGNNLHQKFKMLANGEAQLYLNKPAAPDMPITINEILVRPDTQVVIQPSQEGAGLSIALTNYEQPPRASLYIQKDTQLVIVPETEQPNLTAICEMTIEIIGEEQLELELIPVITLKSLFRSDFEIGAIDFTSLRDEPDVRIRSISKIISGMLYIEDLQGRDYLLRKGEILDLGIDQMKIRSLVLEKRFLHMELDGVVNKLNLGSKNLMPRLLQYWHAQNEWSLFWATATEMGTMINSQRRISLAFSWIRNSGPMVHPSMPYPCRRFSGGDFSFS